LRRRLQNLIPEPANHAGFFILARHSSRKRPFQCPQQRLRRLRQLQMTGMDNPDTSQSAGYPAAAYGAQRLHLRLTERRTALPPRPLATILPTVTSW
jgi:hypothetical protein